MQLPGFQLLSGADLPAVGALGKFYPCRFTDKSLAVQEVVYSSVQH